jgi:ferredoxin
VIFGLIQEPLRGLGQEEEMLGEIYFFSGTGNSFYVAKELQAQIPETRLLPIVALLERTQVKSEAKTIGFVFPVQALCIPVALRRLLRKLQVPGDAYVFGVATREGTVFHGFKQINNMLRRNSQELRAKFILTMPTSDPRGKGYRPPTEAEVAKMKAVIDDKIKRIAETVRNRQCHLQKETEAPIKTSYGTIRNFLIERLVVLAHKSSEYFGGVNYFYADQKCTACGICGAICLSGKVRLTEKKLPVWQRHVLCYMCFACVNLCPKQSVQIRSIWAIRSHSTENGRYCHPFANAKQIAAQKVRPQEHGSTESA